MNPLKERSTVTTTKTITTLFISSVLLVGFMAVSLSISQTASATAQGPPEGSPSEDRPTPQCPDDATGFEQGDCTRPADLECVDPFKLDTSVTPARCIQEATPHQTCGPNEVKVGSVCCPSNRGTLKEGKCVSNPNANPNSGTTPTQTQPTCDPAKGFTGGSGFNLEGTGANAKCIKEGPKPTPDCDDPFNLEDGQCVTRPGNRPV